MKCERCGKEILDVVMVHKARNVIDTLSSMAKIYHLFCSDECRRLKQEEDWKKGHPYP
jgi:hypothetical protein